MMAETEGSPMPKTLSHDAIRKQALDRTKSAIRAYAKHPCAATENAVETAVRRLKREGTPSAETPEALPKDSQVCS